MNYEEVLDRIHHAQKSGIKLDLERMKRLLFLLGSPQLQCKMIHVAGTNGKGSTTATLAAMLRAAGYRTGMYISPFIQDFCERISVDGVMIPQSALCVGMERIFPLAKAMEQEECGAPTEFELVTALAFCHFAQEQCDYVVLEVGLGGRFDATNIIPTPLVSVICSISMDHMDYLGDTIEKIAFEKAGIIKESGTTVLYPLQKEGVFDTVEEIARERHNELIVPDTSELIIEEVSTKGCYFIYKGQALYTPLLGEHQVFNAITAYEAALVLETKIKLPHSAVVEGMKQVRFPGRFEILRENPTVVIDGGHNSDGILSTLHAVRRFYAGRRILAVVGLCKDKEYPYIIGEIAKICKVFVATKGDTPRALEPSTIETHAKEYCRHVFASGNPVEGLQLALSKAKAEDVVLCCGSLYIIGDIRTYLSGQ